MILSIYVRPLYTHSQQEHHRKTFRRQVLHRTGQLRLGTDLQRRTITELPIIRTYATNRIELAKWGFWPEEWKHSTRVRAQINARLETAAEKPMFASSFQTRHCPVIADGYYEWRTVAGRKQPYRITLKTGEPFAMAGIYAREPTGFDTAEKNPVNFAILTTKANEAVSHIHDRMPVILPLGRENQWLQPNPSGQFFMPDFPPDLLTTYPVTPKMNKAIFNDPAAILPSSLR